MRKLLIGLSLLALIACRKDPVETVRPATPKPDTDSIDQDTAGKDSVIIPQPPFTGILDIEGINFSPSRIPQSFVSRAFGRQDSNGHSPDISLSSTGWTHPSVVYLDQPWQGFKYWLAITPYPDADNQYENPHIFCSNDGINWREPAGIRNPIEVCPPGKGYNSDVNLLMDDNVLYCYFRVSGVLKGRALYVMKSKDGIHWSSKELVCEWPAQGIDLISPSVVKDATEYHCYGICTGESMPGEYYSKISIRKMVSSSPITGFLPERDSRYKLINIKGRPWGRDQDPWHLEVQKVNKFWFMLVTTTNHGGYGSGGRLFLGYSTDGINFEFGNRPLGKVYGTYKSSFNITYDQDTKRFRVELWRAMTNYWAVFHDIFFISTGPQFLS